MNQKGRRASRPAPFFAAASVADKRVLQSQFFFFELMKQVIVGMRAMLFGINLGVKRGVFGCKSLSMGIVHRSISFRWLTQDSHDKSRIAVFVAPDLHRFGGGSGRFAVGGHRG